MDELSYFSERERVHQAALRQRRDRLFSPLVRVLARLRLHPDAISFAGVALLVPAIWLYRTASWVTFVCLGLYVFCDDFQNRPWLANPFFRGFWLLFHNRWL